MLGHEQLHQLGCHFLEDLRVGVLTSARDGVPDARQWELRSVHHEFWFLMLSVIYHDQKES